MENAKLAEEPYLELSAVEEPAQPLKAESAWLEEEKVPRLELESPREKIERLVPGLDLKRLVL